MVDSSDDEDLNCPICLELPKERIYQCLNGHIICEECMESVNNCPECRVLYSEGRSRNLTAEKIVSKLKTDCFYKTYGCDERVRRVNLQQHSLVCNFNPDNKKVHICKLIGFEECNFETVSGPGKKLDEITKHFLSEHGAIAQEGDNIIFRVEEFEAAASNGNACKWSPIILNPNGLGGSTMLIVPLTNGTDGYITWVNIILGGKSENFDLFKSTMKLQFKKGANKFTHVASIFKFEDLAGLLELPNQNGIHLDLLKKCFLNGDGSITVSIKLLPNKVHNATVDSVEEPNCILKLYSSYQKTPSPEPNIASGSSTSSSLTQVENNGSAICSALRKKHFDKRLEIETEKPDLEQNNALVKSRVVEVCFST